MRVHHSDEGGDHPGQTSDQQHDDDLPADHDAPRHQSDVNPPLPVIFRYSHRGQHHPPPGPHHLVNI